MSYQFNISDMGLRLIKAYEGFVPDGRLMRDGRRIVGYGRVTSDKDMVVSKIDAETMLKDDLAVIEDLINTNVHASMTQSQFDALCSLAYSIGPKAFLGSSTLHAMNKGEVITAANGFDGWRLGNIDGQIYVVDALVRRRTAEKALFLRPTLRTVPAPHEALPAYEDTSDSEENVARFTSAAQMETETQSNVIPLHRRDDTITTSTIIDEDMDNDADILTLENEETETFSSPIAEAAAEVSDRLDALMDREPTDDTDSWPESLVEDPTEPVTFDTHDTMEHPAESYVEDVPMETAHNEYLDSEAEHLEIADLDNADVYEGDERYASAGKYIQSGTTTERQNLWTFVTMIILGLTATLGGLWANMKSNMFFGDMSPLIWSASVALGVLLFLMGLYYLLKQLFGKA